MTILIHPALAADYKAAQALADQHGLEIVLQGRRALLEPTKPATVVVPARIPAPSRARLPRHIYPSGGDAA